MSLPFRYSVGHMEVEYSGGGVLIFSYLILIAPFSGIYTMRFSCDCDSQSQVSFTLLRLHFASKCDFFQFKNKKSHNHSVRLIYTMRFSCDCDSKSQENRIVLMGLIHQFDNFGGLHEPRQLDTSEFICCRFDGPPIAARVYLTNSAKRKRRKPPRSATDGALGRLQSNSTSMVGHIVRAYQVIERVRALYHLHICGKIYLVPCYINTFRWIIPCNKRLSPFGSFSPANVIGFFKLTSFYFY